MKYLSILIVAILLTTSGIFAQDLTKAEKLFLEGNYWSYSILSNVSTFYLDGSFKVFESPFAGGIKRVMQEVEPGLYIAPVIRSDGKDVEGSVSVIFHTTVWRMLGVGVGYDFWKFQKGVEKPDINNLYFTISISLIEG